MKLLKMQTIIALCLTFSCSIVFSQTPSISRFTCSQNDNPDIVYYFNKPSTRSHDYPIIVLCEGSSSHGDLQSVLIMHNYFLEQINALQCGLLTIEKRGIDGDRIDETVFWNNYTRSQRFHDHMAVIKHLENNQPEGWDGTFIFLGVSEGAALVIQLSTACTKTRATMSWVGGGDWNWADELWEFIVKFRNDHWMLAWLYDLLPQCLQFYGPFPGCRDDYNLVIEQIKKNPTSDERFFGMTYLYHADVLNQMPIDYTKIYAPMLVVTGTKDSIINSCDEFCLKAQSAKAPVTYFRVEGMDHWIRKRPDIIEKSFKWLEQWLPKKSSF